MYLGVGLLFFSWPLLVLSLFAAGMFHLQIVYAEEPFLSKTFGTDCQAHRRRVRRYWERRR